MVGGQWARHTCGKAQSGGHEGRRGGGAAPPGDTNFTPAKVGRTAKAAGMKLAMEKVTYVTAGKWSAMDRGVGARGGTCRGVGGGVWRRGISKVHTSALCVCVGGGEGGGEDARSRTEEEGQVARGLNDGHKPRGKGVHVASCSTRETRGQGGKARLSQRAAYAHAQKDTRAAGAVSEGVCVWRKSTVRGPNLGCSRAAHSRWSLRQWRPRERPG